MSAAAVFDALRALKREMTGQSAIGLDQPEVDAFQALINRWNAPQTAPDASGSAIGVKQVSDSQTPAASTGGRLNGLNPTGLSDEAAFFASVRGAFGSLSQAQVGGFQTLLQSFAVAAWPVAYAAYGLATGWRETNRTMQPVREAYWLSEEWRKNNLKYWPWYGRGFVQLTWQKNYSRADDELGLAGALLADPDKALEPDIASMIMVRGMAEGWFSGKKLADYLPSGVTADIHEFTNARWIVNGQDHSVEIAENALEFQTALLAGGWA